MTTRMTESTCLLVGIVEIVVGWFGFLGVGHILAGIVEERHGRVINGFLFMVCWWIVIGVLAAITAVSAGLGIICTGPVWLIVPLISGISLMKGK